MEELGDGLRTRSFRNEDYNNRRVFLTSYPLHFDNKEDRHETQAHTTTTTCVDTSKPPHIDENKKEKMKKKKEAMKKLLVATVEWIGGRFVVLRRFKCKVSFYVFACIPIVFKPPKALISSS